MSNVVYVCFLKDVDPDEHIMNRLTNYVGSLMHGAGCHHVEFCFPDRGDYWSTSIYQGETVSISREKTFRNPGYKVYSMTVSDESLENAKRFIKSCVSNVAFSPLAMYMSTLPVQLLPETYLSGTTFCSKYVGEILQLAGISYMERVNTNILTPSKLLKVVGNKCPPMLGTVSYKAQSMHVSNKSFYSLLKEDHR